ncbi:MAG TPA: hypothetical protein DCL21_03795 [Alphaproteobacteria bacterium]|nr:hypothetical protein [Alphaproteobacteria bacterium]
MNVQNIGKISIAELNNLCRETLKSTNDKTLFIFRKQSDFEMSNLMNNEYIVPSIKIEERLLLKNALSVLQLLKTTDPYVTRPGLIYLIEVSKESEAERLFTLLSQEYGKKLK